MADSKITALAALTAADPVNDMFPVVDVSDTSMAASGTTKRISVNNILSSSPTASGALTVTGLVTAGSTTITGAATVGTTLGVTGVSTFAAGTALLPALTTTGDTNTGIYYPAADTFAVTTGGAERYRVDSSGNVGVGLTPRVKLDVNGGLLVNNYGTSSNYAPLSVTTASTITTPSTFTNAINIWNPTTVGAYSNITFGYNALGLTNAPAYIGFVSTTSTSGGFGDLVFGTRDVGTDTAATERVRIDASGNLLVGKTAVSGTTLGAQLQSNGAIASGMVEQTNAALNMLVYSTGAAASRFYVGMGGTVFATNTTISAISDARLKENVQDLDVGLDAILALKPRKFDWKAGKGKDIKGDRGFIAQEFETVFPNLIDEWKDKAPEGEAPYKSVRQDLIPVLVKAIQELTARVQTLEAR